MVYPKVEFKLDVEKEVWNYWSAANSTPKWGNDFSKVVPEEIVKKVRNKSLDDVREYLTKCIKNIYKKHEAKIKNYLRDVERSWKAVNGQYFSRLELITKNPFFTDRVQVNPTTIGRCPYYTHDNSLMICVGANNPKVIIAHELMHLQFHYYFEDDLRKIISEEDFGHIKEALTVLLNIEFRDLLDSEDYGYPNHKRLRKFIADNWKKTKDLDLVLERCIGNLNLLVDN